jgi:hypothetical protein
MEVVTYASALVLLRRLNKAQRKHKKLAEMTTYLADLIDKYDVPLTEFDAIALHDMAREHNG